MTGQVLKAELKDGTLGNYEAVASYFNKLESLARECPDVFNDVARVASGVKTKPSDSTIQVLHARWIFPPAKEKIEAEWHEKSPAEECFFAIAKLSVEETGISKLARIFNVDAQPKYRLVSPFKYAEPVNPARVPANKLVI